MTLDALHAMACKLASLTYRRRGSCGVLPCPLLLVLSSNLPTSSGRGGSRAMEPPGGFDMGSERGCMPGGRTPTTGPTAKFSRQCRL